MDPSGRFLYHVKVAPSSDCTKSSNSSAFCTTGGPFMTGCTWICSEPAVVSVYGTVEHHKLLHPEICKQRHRFDPTG